MENIHPSKQEMGKIETFSSVKQGNNFQLLNPYAHIIPKQLNKMENMFDFNKVETPQPPPETIVKQEPDNPNLLVNPYAQLHVNYNSVKQEENILMNPYTQLMTSYSSGAGDSMLGVSVHTSQLSHSMYNNIVPDIQHVPLVPHISTSHNVSSLASSIVTSSHNILQGGVTSQNILQQQPSQPAASEEYSIPDQESQPTKRPRDKSNARPFECETCFRRFNQKQTLKQHILTHTGQRPFECNVCFKTFTQQGALQRHMVIHTGEKPFECTFCELSFRQKINLLRHMKLHTGAPKEFRCRICDREFSRKGALLRHVPIHDSERPRLKCSCCNKEFLNKESLTRHEKQQELREKGILIPKRKVSRNGKVEKILVKCEHCCKLFRRSKSVLCVVSELLASSCLQCSGESHHVSGIHREVEIFQCDLCQAIFQKAGSYEKHKQLHSDKRKYECDVCHLRFKEKRFIRTHIATHFEVCEHQCHLCGLNFKTSAKLKGHYVTHYMLNEDLADFDVTVYACVECERTFYQRNQIVRHLKSHEKKKIATNSLRGRSNSSQERFAHGTPPAKGKTFTGDKKKRGGKENNVGNIPASFPESSIMSVIKQEDNGTFRSYSRRVEGVPSKNSSGENGRLDIEEQNVDHLGTSLSDPLPQDVVHSEEFSMEDDSHVYDDDMSDDVDQEENKTLEMAESENKWRPSENSESDMKGRNGTLVTAGVERNYGNALETSQVKGNYRTSSESEVKGKNSTHSETLKSKENKADLFAISEVKGSNGMLSEPVEDRSETHPFHCYICKRSYTKKRSLKRHFQVAHTNYDKFPCEMCSKTFQTKNSLKQHYVLHKPHSFNCDQCDKTFNRKDALASHKLIHSDTKSFLCPYCPKSFFQKQSLHTHLIQHKGDKSYECGVCGKSFYEKSTLNRHYLSHSGERKYSCYICNMSFIQKNHLDKHFLRHDEIEKKVSFQCEDCEKCFYRKDHYLRHRQSHEENRTRYPCDKCEKLFTDKYSLARHVKEMKCLGKEKGKKKVNGTKKKKKKKGQGKKMEVISEEEEEDEDWACEIKSEET